MSEPSRLLEDAATLPEVARLLRAGRSESLSPVRRTAIATGISAATGAALAAGAALEGVSAGGAAAAGHAGAATLWKLVGLGVLVATIGGGAWVARYRDVPSHNTLNVPVSETAPITVGEAASRAPVSVAPTVALSAVAEASTTAAPGSPQVPTHATPVHPAPAPPPQPSAPHAHQPTRRAAAAVAPAQDTLRIEVAMLAEIKRLLNASDGAAAQARLANYRAMFAHGVLVMQADVLEIELAQHAGATVKVRALADAFLQRYPHVPASERVRRLRVPALAGSGGVDEAPTP